MRGLARMYDCMSSFILAKVLRAFFEASRDLTGIFENSPVTVTVVPTGAATATESQGSSTKVGHIIE
ncbi:hypothetical protein VTJ49DRAFT_4450 [Mycothermus thermophilus]|uniref:Uncharacterized protein n=1 Tax=Humicola insolens TaxID=85995 RepID=A0ABR3V596_HUMIN